MMPDARGHHVVHVSSAHPWTDNRIHYRECVSLVEAGFRVTLIATDSPVEGAKTGVEVITIPRIARTMRVLFGAPRAIGLALRTRARVVHLHDPELVWAVPILRILGKRVVYDAHEDLPVQVLSKSYLNGVTRPIAVLGAHCLVGIAGLSSHVIAATETVARRFPKSRTSVVRNYPPLRPQEAAARPIEERDRAAVYVGGIGSNRGIDVMVDAVSQPHFPPGWQLRIAGSAPLAITEGVPRSAAGRIDFRGQLAPELARELQLECRIGLVLLQDTAAYRDSLPTKMFEYFAAGLPVIASDFPAWRPIVHDNDCGILVDQTSPSAVADALRVYAEQPDLLRVHSANARRLALELYNWASEARTLLVAYAKLTST